MNTLALSLDARLVLNALQLAPQTQFTRRQIATETHQRIRLSIHQINRAIDELKTAGVLQHLTADTLELTEHWR